MTFPWTEPEVKKSINRLTYTWRNLDLIIDADRLTDTGQAELWFYHSNGSGTNLLHIAKVNLLSSSTMTQLAKKMVTHSEDIPWGQAMTFITKTSMEFQRRGEPGVTIQPVSAELLKPFYYIEPVIIKGVPNIIFGEKGVNKTTLCLTMLGLITIGVDESKTGFGCSSPAKVAMLDFEGTKELTDYTLARLIEGDTVPYFEMPYLRCRQKLSDDIQRIANFLHDCHAEIVLIDSLGKAAGSDKFDSSGKTAALNFFECLDQLNITSLIIGQTSKTEEGKKTIFGSTYFTYYARNIFELRSKGDDLNDDQLHLGLFHHEANYSKKYPPIGLNISYTDTTISILSEPVSLSQYFEKANLTKSLLEYLQTGAKSVKAISTELQLPDKRVRTLLSQQKAKQNVIDLGSGVWGVLHKNDDI